MPSLKAIAADLGVSHALVSRVLNNRMGTTRVSPATRKAILDRAQELDYQPNPLAVALKKGRKGAVGVFWHGIGVEGSELSFDFMQSAGEALSDLGLNLWLQFFQRDEEFLKACNQKLMRKIDGLIVAGLAHSELQGKLMEIESHGLHVVSACHGSIPGHSKIANFQVNYERQCHLTTEHLLQVGCRKIAHFNNNANVAINTGERYQGYLNAMTEAGITPDPRLIIPIKDYSSNSGYAGMKVLIENGIVFDGLCAQSDAQAAGAMRCLIDMGWPRERWPKMTGVDDSPIARYYCHIPLTSATAEMRASAKYAVATLFQKIEGHPIVPRLIEPKLVVRQSTVG